MSVLVSMQSQFSSKWEYLRSASIEMIAFPASIDSIAQLVLKPKEWKAQVLNIGTASIAILSIQYQKYWILAVSDTSIGPK